MIGLNTTRDQWQQIWTGLVRHHIRHPDWAVEPAEHRLLLVLKATCTQLVPWEEAIKRDWCTIHKAATSCFDSVAGR